MKGGREAPLPCCVRAVVPPHRRAMAASPPRAGLWRRACLVQASAAGERAQGEGQRHRGGWRREGERRERGEKKMVVG